MLNNITIHGRLTKDVELRYTKSEKAVSSFTVACDRPGKDSGADFIPCVAWEKTAEMLDRYFHKGSQILVSGRLAQRDYEDKNGNKRKTYEVVVNTVDFCDSNKTETTAFVEVDDDDGDIPF